MYEWGIWSNSDNSLHRTGMTQVEAEEWVRSWEEDIDRGGYKFKRNLFSVCRRPLGEWAVVDNS